MFAPSRSQHEDDPERPDLEKVLSHYGLDTFGRGGMFVCVLHDDMKPSMSVDQKKGLVNCHACGKGGSSWDIIMIKESLDFRGAREYAAGAGWLSEEGDAGGTDEGGVRSFYAGGGRLAPRKGTRKERRTYRPTWSGAE